MKKFITVLLTAALCIGCATGCSEKSTGEDSITVVRVWTNDSGGKVVWDALVDEYNRTTGKEKGIKIEWTTYSSDYETIVDVARQNDQLPEIFAQFGSRLAEYAASGDILPVEEVAGGKEFLDEYQSPTIEGMNMQDGKVYALYSRSNTIGLIYNKDLFIKAGIVDSNGEPTPPTTLAEAREYAKLLTNPKDNTYGYSFPLKAGVGYPLERALAASVNGTFTPYNYDDLTVDFSNWKKAMQWVLDMKDDGSLFPGAENLDNDTSRAYFAEGKIGMVPAVSWDVAVYTTQFVANFDWDVASFPLMNEDVKTHEWRDLSGMYAMTKSIQSSTEEKVMEVYKFIYSFETRMKMYESSVSISCKNDVIEAADNTKIIPQFEKFASFLDDEYVIKAIPPLKLEGDSYTKIMEKVFVGQMSLDDAIDDLNTRYSDALKKGVADGSIDVSKYQ